MGQIFRIFLILTIIWGPLHAAQAKADPLIVFAAASTKGPMDDIAALAKNIGMNVTMVYAGSSLLARQIENGAPAHVFISAHPLWIKRLKDRSIIYTQSITNIASNRLVLIANKKMFEKNRLSDGMSPGDVILNYLKSDFLAVADPDHVPAGIYAKEALVSIGLWDKLKNKLAKTMDVTAVLALVKSGEAPFGIVYASDVRDGVVLVTKFNENDHSPIIYSVAALKHDDNKDVQVASFIKLLISEHGKKAFIDYGFTEPAKQQVK